MAHGCISVGVLIVVAGVGCGGHLQGTDDLDESSASVSFLPLAASEALSPSLSFTGFARQAPSPITGQWNVQELHLIISDANECEGAGAPTREIDLDVYAYANPQGAVPGTYEITNTSGSSASSWTTWSLSGFGDVTIDSGDLTLTQVASTVTTGRFQANAHSSAGQTFTLTGSFSAPFCTGGSTAGS